MEIRPPNKPNYPGVAAMLSQAFGQPWDAEDLMGRVMADPLYDPNLVYLAREKGETLGFAATVVEGENAWLKLIAIAPSRQRQGLGREMLDRLRERLRGEGARRWQVGFAPPPFIAPPPSAESLGFFQALGFSAQPGGCLGKIVGHAGLVPDKPNFDACRSLMQAVNESWWPEVEERLSFKITRCAQSRDQKALALAEPGRWVGPVFGAADASEGSLQEAAEGALALAAAQPGELRFWDSRPLSFWSGKLPWVSLQPLSQLTREFD